jgi:hypothetical protein
MHHKCFQTMRVKSMEEEQQSVGVLTTFDAVGK